MRRTRIMMVCLLEFHSVPAYHLLGGFIKDESAVNREQAYDPALRLRPVDETSNREGGWHNFVGSLEERYASGKKPSQHVENNNSYEWRSLDPALVSCIENMAGQSGYPFWRVRCKVRFSFPSSSRFLIHMPLSR